MVTTRGDSNASASGEVPRQGDIWWAETESKRRPVLVVTRDSAIDRLSQVTVAPITSRMRRIPTEVSLGPEEGLSIVCAASFDNLTGIRLSQLVERVGVLPFANSRICGAIAALADC